VRARALVSFNIARLVAWTSWFAGLVTGAHAVWELPVPTRIGYEAHGLRSRRAAAFSSHRNVIY